MKQRKHSVDALQARTGQRSASHPHDLPIRQTVMLTAPAAQPLHLARTGLFAKTVSVDSRQSGAAPS
ncbi:hypothetical protein [Paraburkholderia susongensis]|uniref:hypothetical protein n=1 Tax=Paraburkholderia susongensis TaxID=1515439 RepID=UPI001ABFD234|nr:hypothetical protein [Paraburkholderia susongensis]